MEVILKDGNYNKNKSEMIINFKNKEFDGQMTKSILNIKFRFGVKCSQSVKGLSKNEIQEINQEILWTEYDVNSLKEQIDFIFKKNSELIWSDITLFEPEFRALYYYYPKENMIDLIITVGIDTNGSSIRLYITKDSLLKWMDEIIKFFNS